jgi:hypothetical protein
VWPVSVASTALGAEYVPKKSSDDLDEGWLAAWAEGAFDWPANTSVALRPGAGKSQRTKRKPVMTGARLALLK